MGGGPRGGVVARPRIRWLTEGPRNPPGCPILVLAVLKMPLFVLIGAPGRPCRDHSGRNLPFPIPSMGSS